MNDDAAPAVQDAPPPRDLVAYEFMAELMNIAHAKRFYRKQFENDTAFAEWAQSRAQYALRAAPAVADAPPPHADDLAVDRFAAAMKKKLAQKRDEGRGGWDDRDACTGVYLRQLLRGHVAKGDPVDVGNLAMMLWNRG